MRVVTGLLILVVLLFGLAAQGGPQTRPLIVRPTRTPTPTVTPTPKPDIYTASSVVIDFEHMTARINIFDDLIIYGEVINREKVDVDNVYIHGAIFDGEGHLVHVATARTEAESVPAGGKGCFAMSFREYDKSLFVNLALTGYYSKRSGAREYGVQVLQQAVSTDQRSPDYLVSGTITNTNSTFVDSTEIVATFYDEEDNVVGCSSDNLYDEIEKGKSEEFEIGLNLPEEFSMDHYTLHIEADVNGEDIDGGGFYRIPALSSFREPATPTPRATMIRRSPTATPTRSRK